MTTYNEVHLEVVARMDADLNSKIAGAVDLVYPMLHKVWKQIGNLTVTEFTGLAATGGGTTITTSGYTGVYAVYLVNKDPTNYITATYRSAGGGGNDQTQRVAANGGMMLITDFTKANNLVLVANTAAAEYRALIVRV